jgi:hypothetical protein
MPDHHETMTPGHLAACATIDAAPQWMRDRAKVIITTEWENLDYPRAVIIEAMQEAGREVAFYFAGQDAKLKYEAGAEYQRGVVDTMKLATPAAAAVAAEQRDLQVLADKVVIANATGNEKLFLSAVRELLDGVRALRTGDKP